MPILHIEKQTNRLFSRSQSWWAGSQHFTSDVLVYKTHSIFHHIFSLIQGKPIKYLLSAFGFVKQPTQYLDLQNLQLKY